MNTEPPDTADRTVALVTGSSTGIGRCISEHLIGAGFRVYGCSRRQPDWISNSDNYTHIICDVANEAAVTAMIKKIYRLHGRLDIAINNAAVAVMNHSLLTPASTLQKLFDTNVNGTFVVCREAAKIMKRKRYGRIINFTSIAVPLSLEGQSAYVASKTAVEGLTRVLASEFAAFGITVNAIGPGPTDTLMTHRVPDHIMKKTLELTGRSKLADVREVLPTLDRLLQSSDVTGQIIYLTPQQPTSDHRE